MRIVVLLGLLMLSSPGWGKLFDGNRLYRLCQADEKTYDAGSCFGFIAGVSDILVATKNQREVRRRICLPRRTSDDQLKAVVVDYLDLVPQLRGYDAVFLVEMALRAAYPCKI